MCDYPMLTKFTIKQNSMDWRKAQWLRHLLTQARRPEFKSPTLMGGRGGRPLVLPLEGGDKGSLGQAGE